MLVRANAECFIGNGYRARGAIFDYVSTVPDGTPDPDLNRKEGERFALLTPLSEAEVAAYWAEQEEKELLAGGTQPPDFAVLGTPRRPPAASAAGGGRAAVNHARGQRRRPPDVRRQ